VVAKAPRALCQVNSRQSVRPELRTKVPGGQPGRPLSGGSAMPNVGNGGAGEPLRHKEKAMSGIIVGVDGSGHSQRALEWAMKEAALRHVPVTVFTVHQAIRDNLGFIASSPGDADLTAKAEAAAKAETEKVPAVLGSSRPE